MSGDKNEFSFENEQYRKTYWHTCSHVMAQAVKRLWPEVKLAIGPSIDNGFYYDFETPQPFTEDQLTELEAENGVRYAAPRKEAEQVSLAALGEGEVLDALRRCQPDTLTPIEAMGLLYELKRKLE